MTCDYMYVFWTRLDSDQEAQLKEIERRLGTRWAASGKLEDVFKSKLPRHLKTMVYNNFPKWSLLPPVLGGGKSLGSNWGALILCGAKANIIVIFLC